MKKYFIFFIFLSLLFSLEIFAQNGSVFEKKIIASEGKNLVDSNFINQNYFKIYLKNNLLSDSLYYVNFTKGEVIFDETLYNDTLLIEYKLLKPNISFSVRDTSIFIPVIEKEPLFLDSYSKKSNNSSEIQTNGTIKRGFASGNNQSFSINTDLDLRISGKVSENLFLDCNISDSSIPVDYGQSTTSLQELDKIYIKLYNDKNSLKGGDIIINNLSNPFLNFNRNAIGLNYNYNDSNIITNSSVGVTKNMFRRQNINVLNGNQGPYKLTGNNNELYVLIIPNSETVYIDGVKKNKGNTKDYTINYSTGEIIFTPNIIINENQRIIVEFQYSGQNYFRWLSHFGSNFKKGNFNFRINFFSEQDSKNNPVTNFSDNQINQMVNGGDHLIYSNNFNSVDYSENTSQILYAKKDTIDMNLIQHNDIYFFSNNLADTLYNVHFEFVGEGLGNYVLNQNLINGNVFTWVAPLNGLNQGSYEPRKLLTPPKKQQMLMAGFDYQNNDNLFSLNVGLSNYDENTFSNLNDNNNIGWAMNLSAKKNILFKKIKLQTNIKYDFLDENFEFVDRTRSLEFQRNWNIPDSLFNSTNQHNLKINFITDLNNYGQSSYSFDLMNINNDNKYLHTFITDFNKKKIEFKIFSSLLNDHTEKRNTTFTQYNFLIKKTGKLTFGINNIGERKYDLSNPLTKSNYNKFILFSSILRNKVNLFDLNYINRFDLKPDSIGYTNENTFELKSSLIQRKNAKINLLSSYSSYSSMIENESKKEENIMARLTYSLSIKQYLSFNGYYEISNGKEYIRDYRFIKVNPGYGSYSWNDYNSNGLEEFDEFENSNFADTADYIRVSFPSNESFNVRNLKFNQQFRVNPEFSGNKFLSILSRTQNTLNLQIDKKFLSDELITFFNPFSLGYSNMNTLNLNFNVINNFIYKSSNNYLFIYKIKRSLLKNTLTSGDEYKKILDHIFQAQKTYKLLVVNINYINNYSNISNNNMINRNYKITKNEIKSELLMDFKKISPSIWFAYINKDNTNNENLSGRKLGLNLDLLLPKNFVLKKSVMAFNMKYSGNAFSSIGHEMLEGLPNGKGMEIHLSILKSINKTSFSIQYNGRLNKDQLIHNARFELKKYF